ncbi:hypothetical protein [Psittacicella hinzii]|uniref:hypothetical protein n=1 Tax=Psittacicella hinzii TaxID=2028575 RepID=UPI001FE5D600|nr:hypothetical protein [Psittacicella hinzii]
MSKQIPDFCNLLQELNQKQIQVIIDFTGWLDEVETTTHSDYPNKEKTDSYISSKQSVLAFVLTDTFKQKATILDLLREITQINQSIHKQYAPHTENFSNEKSIKELTYSPYNSEKFESRVNEIISKLLPKFLGLPILIAILGTLKSGDNWLTYTAICLYCLLCWLNLNYQKQILDNINHDVNQFDQEGKVPLELKANWQKKIRIE